eukprot:1524845-Pyramimonas_sp.AAC.1
MSMGFGSRAPGLSIGVVVVVVVAAVVVVVVGVVVCDGFGPAPQELYEVSGHFVRRGAQSTNGRIKAIYDTVQKPQDRMKQASPPPPPCPLR